MNVDRLLSVRAAVLAALGAALVTTDVAGAAITFAPRQDVAVPTASSVAIGDFNGDRKPDLAVTSRDRSTLTGGVAILLGKGTGAFAAPVTVPTPAGSYPYGVAVGDLNADGKQDLAVVDTSSTMSNVDTHASILLGDGTGGFTGRGVLVTSGIAAPYAVAVGDVNADGRQDLVTVGRYSRVAGENVGLVASLLGDGTAAFPTRETLIGGELRRALALGDLNADGKVDVTTTSSGREDFPGVASALLSNGTGAFGPDAGGVQGADTGLGSTSVAIGDFNGDARPDTAVANYSSDDVSVLLGDGGGGFASSAAFPAHDGPRSVAVGDFDGDGRADLAVANAISQDVSILPGTGTGSFGAPLHLPAGAIGVLEAARSFGDGGRLRVGDLDCNGTHDLVMAGDQSETVSVFMNARPGTAPAGCEPDRTGPAVSVLSTSLRLSTTGSVAVKVRCPAGEPAGCASTIRIRTASKVRVSPSRTRIVTLGTLKKTLTAGRATTVRVRLSLTNRRLIHKLKRVRVKVSVQALDQARNSRTTTKTLTLRR